MVANGQFEAIIATEELQFEISDVTFRENFAAMSNVPSFLIGLLFLKRNSLFFDMRQGILNYHFFSMHLKNEDRTCPKVIEPILNPVETKLQPEKRIISRVNTQIHTDKEATGLFQTSPLLENDEDFLSAQHFRQPKTTNIWSKSAFFWTTHKHSRRERTWQTSRQLTLEQTKHIRPVNLTSRRHLLNNNHENASQFIKKLFGNIKNR